VGELRVLAYLNTQKWIFSIEAKEGPDTGRVISEVNEVVLRKALISKNKRKVGPVLGIWDSELNGDNAERIIFGPDENSYKCIDIRLDFRKGKYIEDDLARVLGDGEEDSYIYLELEKDPSLNKEICQREMDLLYLKADDELHDISGYFCMKVRNYVKTAPQDNKKDVPVSGENRVEFFPKGTDP